MNRTISLLFVTVVAGVIILTVFLQRDEILSVRTIEYWQESQWNVQLYPSSYRAVNAPVSGFITHVDVQVMDRVGAGDLLCAYDTTLKEYALAKARSEYARALVQESAAIQEERRLAMVLAQRDWEMSQIFSPVDGVISRVSITANTHVESGRELFQIIPDEARWQAEISEEAAGLIQKSQFFAMSLTNRAITYSQSNLSIQFSEGRWWIQLPQKDSGLSIIPGQRAVIAAETLVEPVAWIPVSFVNDGKVRDRQGRIYQIEILDRSEDMVLIKGLEEGLHIQKRRF